MRLNLRQEIKEDYKETYEVVKNAFLNAEFTDHNEQNLVNKLRKSNTFIKELSIIAEKDSKIVGHILFTKIKIGDNESLALAPISVLEEYQNKGVGKELILKGHEIAKSLGFKSVIVLGHPTYYKKFGYKNAIHFNIKAPFDVLEDCFMAIELIDGGLKGVSGVVEYPKVFLSN